MAFQAVTVVEVRAFGKRVGAVAASPSLRAYEFEYDPAWTRLGIELAPILMPTTAREGTHVFPELAEKTFQRLPPMIADSLPDAFGNSIVDAWLATKGIAARDVTALDRLTYLGERGLGALEYHPVRSPSDPPPDALDLSALVNAARDAVQGTLSTDRESEQALQRIISVGTSAGGARAKAIVNYNEVTREVRAGHVAPPEGFTSWLLKFDGIGADHELGATKDYGRIEFAYSSMAAAAGIAMAPARLLHENGRAHFMTRRFDRPANSDRPGGAEKLHSQTLTGIAAVDFNARGTNDYAQLFTAISQLGLDEATREQAFRRMVFNVAAANCDDHAKNHGFLMDAAGTWSLSPAYDVTHAYNPKGEWTYQHLMGVGGKFQGITRADLMLFAERHGVSRVKAIIGDVNDALDNWSEYAADAGLNAEAAATVARDHVRL